MNTHLDTLHEDVPAQEVSLSVLFAIWLIVGLATYAYTLFNVWLPQIERAIII